MRRGHQGGNVSRRHARSRWHMGGRLFLPGRGAEPIATTPGAGLSDDEPIGGWAKVVASPAFKACAAAVGEWIKDVPVAEAIRIASLEKP